MSRDAAFREERYAAVELPTLPRCLRWIEPRRVPLIDELVVTGAWWDYVGAIAGRAIGAMLTVHPQPMKTLLRDWPRSNNVWKHFEQDRDRVWADYAKSRAGRISATVVLRGVLEQFPPASPEVDVRDDRLWLEHHPVVVRAHLRSVELFREVGHVVAETEEVLLVLSLSPTLQVTSIWFDWSSTEHSPSIDSR